MGWADAPALEPAQPKWMTAPALDAKGDKGRDPRDGMTPGERAKAAREGTLKPPSDARLTDQSAIDRQAEIALRDPGALPTVLAAGAQGATFGFADEIVGAGGAALSGARDLVTGNWSGMTDRAGNRYASDRDFARATIEAGRDARPKTAMASEIAGAVAVPVGMAPRGAGIVRAGAQNALTGMGLAGLYGAGTAEGGLVDRAQNALAAAPLGFAIGAASPVVANALLGVFGGIASAGRGVIDRVRGTASEKAANRAISRVIDKSGQSPDDIVSALRRAAAEGQPEYRLMDATGQAGQRAASTVVRRGDDGAESLTNFLRQRQTDQSTRVPRMIEDAYDASKSAAKTTEALKASRKAAADTAYTAARGNAGPVNLTDTIATIDDLTMRDPLLGESALKATEIGSRLSKLRDQMATGDSQLIDFNQVLNIKQDLGGIIEGLRKSGKPVSPELAKVYGSLDSALEGASDMYRTANDGFRTASGVIDAVDEGANMARPGARAQDTTSRFAAMTPEQQAAARVGYADKVLGGIEANKAITSNKASAFNSTKAAEEAAVMAKNPDTFGRQITRENEMWGTMNRALGGSRTADNLMDEAMSIPTGPGRQAVVDALRLNFGGAATNLAIAIAPALRGQSPATRKLIADALMSADPEVALRAAAQSVKDQGVKRVIERAITSAGAVTTAN